MLQERGFRTIVNFRTPGEQGADIDASREAAEAAGLNYVHLPFRTPTAEIRRGVPRHGGRAVEPAGLHPLRLRQPGRRDVAESSGSSRTATRSRDATAEAEAIGLRSPPLKNFALEYLGAGD